jgi:hypothetical protein
MESVEAVPPPTIVFSSVLGSLTLCLINGHSCLNTAESLSLSRLLSFSCSYDDFYEFRIIFINFLFSVFSSEIFSAAYAIYTYSYSLYGVCT